MLQFTRNIIQAKKQKTKQNKTKNKNKTKKKNNKKIKFKTKQNNKKQKQKQKQKQTKNKQIMIYRLKWRPNYTLIYITEMKIRNFHYCEILGAKHFFPTTTNPINF